MKQLSVITFLLFSCFFMQGQIRDTLFFLTDELQLDRSNVQVSSLTGLQQQDNTFTASNGHKFVQMSPSGNLSFRDSLLYLVPNTYRGRSFSSRSIQTRNQKAVVYTLTCPTQHLEVSRDNRTLTPGRGCRFSRYRNGVGLKGKYLLIVPEY